MTNRDNMKLRWRVAQGQYIRELRESLGLTGQDVADAVDRKAKQLVSGWETGRVDVSERHISSLAEVLKVTEKSLAKVLLRYQHPWFYAALYGPDEELEAELRAAKLERLPGSRPTVTRHPRTYTQEA